MEKNMLCGFGLLSLLVMIVHKAYAREFMVGGSKGWSVPSDSQMFTQWAQHNRFQIGDSLLFVYTPNQDAVLLVTKEDYNDCNTNSPMAKYTEGHTSFTFNNSGPYYFISGNKDKCKKNEKLVVIVMADRSKNTAPSPSPPAPATIEIKPTPYPSPEPPKNAAFSISDSFFLIFITSIGYLLGAVMTSSMYVPF